MAVAAAFVIALVLVPNVAGAAPAQTTTSSGSATTTTTTPGNSSRGTESGDRWLTFAALGFGLVALGLVFRFLDRDRKRSIGAVLTVSARGQKA